MTPPVTLTEFKAHMRIFTDEMDGSMQIMLDAAIINAENFTLIHFEEDYPDGNVPPAIKAAILLAAGRLFVNPTDCRDRLSTASMNLLKPFRKWDRIESK